MTRKNLSKTFFDQDKEVKQKKATPKAEVMEIRDREIYDRWVSGERVGDISAEYGLSNNAINTVVQKVESDLSRRFMEAHMQMRVRNTQRFEQLYFRAVKAFENSVGDDYTEVVSDTDSGKNVTKTKKKASGDPRYLKEARESLEGIQKLWGLNAPERVQKEVAYHVDSIADDELVRRANAFRGGRERLTAGLAQLEPE